jgi:2-hydroxy-3-keto-5-methylthiopentenyl-1-phosphate phosphatase
MNLATTSVFLDFDGTVTVRDTGVHLLERLAGDDAWRAVDRAYASGAIGSREALTREWEMLPRDEDLLRAVAREVPLDAGLEPLVEGLRAAGAEILVVSDGFGFHVAETLAPFGLAVLTNAVDFTTGVLDFPNIDRCCACSSCGTCKQAPIKDARRRGRDTVFVGDGVSDRKAALLADRLFAKHDLADWCELADVPYEPFRSLADVHAALLG